MAARVLNLCLNEPQILLYYAALVWGDGESVDVSVGHAEIINDCICGEREDHPRLPILVAKINACSTCFR